MPNKFCVFTSTGLKTRPAQYKHVGSVLGRHQKKRLFLPRSGCNDHSLSEENHCFGFFFSNDGGPENVRKNNISFCGIGRTRTVVWGPSSSLVQRAGFLWSGTEHRAHPREQPALITVMPIVLQQQTHPAKTKNTGQQTATLKAEKSNTIKYSDNL